MVKLFTGEPIACFQLGVYEAGCFRGQPIHDGLGEKKQVTGSYFRTKPKQQLSPSCVFTPLSSLDQWEGRDGVNRGGRRREEEAEQEGGKESCRNIETLQVCGHLNIIISALETGPEDQQPSQGGPRVILG